MGGGLGLLLKGKVPENISGNIIRALGLCVCVIGVAGALGGDLMLTVVSIALGAFTGELLDIDGKLNSTGRWLQRKMSKAGADSAFTEGFVAATLLFCVGAMAIVGSVESGLRGDHSVVFTKSILDGVTSMLLASSLGFGVLFSAGAVLLYQGSIELFAGYLQNILTDGLISQISGVGGVMILGIGANMALGAKIKVANLLPGFLFAAGYFYVFMG